MKRLHLAIAALVAIFVMVSCVYALMSDCKMRCQGRATLVWDTLYSSHCECR